MNKAELCTRIYQTLSTRLPVACHAAYSPREITEDRPFLTVSELWFPHAAKSRALRSAGMFEEEIMGAGSDFDRLEALLSSMKLAAGSTLGEDVTSDLAALGCTDAPVAENAEAIWQKTAAYLAKNKITPQTVLENNAFSFVECRFSDLDYLPFGSDRILPIFSLSELLFLEESDFAESVRRMGEVVGFDITSLDGVEKAIEVLLGRAASLGARAMTVDLSGFSEFHAPDPYHAGEALRVALEGRGRSLSREEMLLYRAQILRFFGKALSSRGMRAVWRVRRDKLIRTGEFSLVAAYDLMRYLDNYRVFVPTCLSFEGDAIPPSVVSLFGAFTAKDGTPRLYFGIEAAGVPGAALTEAVQLFASRNALGMFLGMTDTDAGFLTRPSYLRFCRAVAKTLSEDDRDEILPDVCDARTSVATRLCGEALLQFLMT